MIVGVLKESFPSERRVALVPGVISTLRSMNLDVLVEPGAGLGAGFPDSEYEESGAHIGTDRTEVFANADILVQARGSGANPDNGHQDLANFRSGQVVLGFLDPLGDPQSIAALADTGVTSFALELLPRISRAQPMDALSSMAMIGGYKSVLLAAQALPRMFPMLMTAAGTITPAHVFVIGAGVAGLQAIATARRLGAVVEAYDIRAAARQEVESLGARFLDLSIEALTEALTEAPTEGLSDISDGSASRSAGEGMGGYAKAMDEDFYRRQREEMARVVAASDVVITTAAVPGRKAPVLITEEMARGMKTGSVIVDLAAEFGGNCELTRPGETIEVGGVTILGPVNLPSMVPYHASQMFANNISAFLKCLMNDGQINLNLEEPVIKETLVTHLGEVANLRVRESLGLLDPEDETALVNGGNP